MATSGDRVIVSSVSVNSAAQANGITEDDEVVSVDGVVINNLQQYNKCLRDREGKDVVLILNGASGNVKTVTLKLARLI